MNNLTTAETVIVSKCVLCNVGMLTVIVSKS